MDDYDSGREMEQVRDISKNVHRVDLKGWEAEDDIILTVVLSQGVPHCQMLYTLAFE